MKTIAIALTAFIALASCRKESIRGAGRTISETRTVGAFSGVRAEGSTDVEIIQGTQQSVQISGYENLVPIYETDVHNGTLVVKFDNQHFNIRNNNIRVTIVVPAVNGVSLNGSGNISFKNFTGTNFSAEVNGSGDLTGESCTYDNVLFKVNGSGRIHGGSVIAKEAEAEISGSGKIDLYCSQKLTARISGSGDVNYWGNPVTVSTEVSGSGKISKKIVLG